MRTLRSRTLTFSRRLLQPLALVGLVCFAPATAWCAGDSCTGAQPTTSQHEAVTSVRETAAVFVPRVGIRLWIRAGDKQRHRHQERLTRAGFEPPSVRRDVDLSDPYGWEFRLRWDLVEMADAAWAGAPEERSPRPTGVCSGWDRRPSSAPGDINPTATPDQPSTVSKDDPGQGAMP